MNFTVTSCNVNYSRRAEGTFSAFGWANRSESIYNKLEQLNSDILLIQELHQDYIDEFTTRLKHYHWYFQKQNSRGQICNIGIGLRQTTFPLDTVQHFFAHNFNQYGNQACENIVGALIHINDNNNNSKKNELIVLSVHFPMDETARKMMVENFSSLLSLYSSRNKLIIGGDFNAFPDNWGYKQIPMMNALCGTYSATEFAINSVDGKLALKSFQPYPYDYVPAESLIMPGKLDHILVKGFNCTEAIVHNENMTDVMYAPSDHFPITVTLENL